MTVALTLIPASAYTGFLIPTSVQLALSIAVVALVASFSIARQPEYRRLLLGYAVALVGALALRWLLPLAATRATRAPVIDCDYVWWVIECWFRP